MTVSGHLWSTQAKGANWLFISGWREAVGKNYWLLTGHGDSSFTRPSCFLMPVYMVEYCDGKTIVISQTQRQQNETTVVSTARKMETTVLSCHWDWLVQATDSTKTFRSRKREYLKLIRVLTIRKKTISFLLLRIHTSVWSSVQRQDRISVPVPPWLSRPECDCVIKWALCVTAASSKVLSMK